MLRRRRGAAGRADTGRWIVLAHPAGRRARRHGVGGHHGLLRDRFNASEILVSLMLVYVADPWCWATWSTALEGPRWASTSRRPSPSTPTKIPRLIEGSRVNIGLLIALAGVAGLWVFLFRTYAGFAAAGGRPGAGGGAYAGSRRASALWTALLCRAAWRAWPARSTSPGPMGQLTPHVPAGYGFSPPSSSPSSAAAPGGHGFLGAC